MPQMPITAQQNSGSLSPMERELLAYIERLTSALEHSTEQFAALEKRSTDMIERRQAALEGSLKSLIASQASFMTAWQAFAQHSNASVPSEIAEAFEMLEQAEQFLSVLAERNG